MSPEEEQEPRLADFDVDAAASSNGSANGAGTARRHRRLTGIGFGFLIGALLATTIVDRLMWLNLSTTGWWGRPVGAAAAAGAMVALVRRDALVRTAVAGAAAAVLALWGVYGLVRLSVQVLFVERSIVRVVTVDLLRLLAYAAPAGALGAAAMWGGRKTWLHITRPDRGGA